MKTYIKSNVLLKQDLLRNICVQDKTVDLLFCTRNKILYSIHDFNGFALKTRFWWIHFIFAIRLEVKPFFFHHLLFQTRCLVFNFVSHVFNTRLLVNHFVLQTNLCIWHKTLVNYIRDKSFREIFRFCDKNISETLWVNLHSRLV